MIRWLALLALVAVLQCSIAARLPAIESDEESHGILETQPKEGSNDLSASQDQEDPQETPITLGGLHGTGTGAHPDCRKCSWVVGDMITDYEQYVGKEWSSDDCAEICYEKRKFYKEPSGATFYRKWGWNLWARSCYCEWNAAESKIKKSSTKWVTCVFKKVKCP